MNVAVTAAPDHIPANLPAGKDAHKRAGKFHFGLENLHFKWSPASEA
jgi:hypothetical protein